MSEETVAAFESVGFTTDAAWLLDTCGLVPEDLAGWNDDDAITLARAINHQGVDALMAEYLFTAHKGDLSAAFEDMAEDGDE